MDILYHGNSISMLTDLYQVTMAHGYWKLGRAESHSVFHLYFRKLPFKGSYVVACGLETVMQYLENWTVTKSDGDYLRSLMGPDGKPLFDPKFVDYLEGVKLNVNIFAVPEGSPVFPNEPIVRLEGPLLQCQLLETPLLTLLGFQSLVATKAHRVVHAAYPSEVLDFGLRRAQGPDGGMSASRAAFVAGCKASSNVLAGKAFGIPVKGTHAHSWVMAFKTELEAFRSYIDVCPNNAVLLVDTYEAIQGVRNAIIVGKELEERGGKLQGIRLDSGDLAELSKEARALLDAEGMQHVKIVASDDLDEHKIEKLQERGARIDVFGVGTRIACCYDQPALGCVYKIAAIDEGKGWEYTMKASIECPEKASVPGVLQVRRYKDKDGKMIEDEIYDMELGPTKEGGEDVLVLAWSGDRRAQPKPRELVEVQTQCLAALSAVPDDVLKNEGARTYPVSFEPRLLQRRDRMLKEIEAMVKEQKTA
eukprot:Sspe_Gene.36824::Locus_17798_Transcript_1_2_Confidence_0.800_Length_1570::g.36824::m.36824/K00763/pncB, NAPRT1; nicotinate phosphoribosyltransferase